LDIHVHADLRSWRNFSKPCCSEFLTYKTSGRLVVAFSEYRKQFVNRVPCTANSDVIGAAGLADRSGLDWIVGCGVYLSEIRKITADMKLSGSKILGLSALAGFTIVLALAGYSHFTRRSPVHMLKLNESVFVAEQIQLRDIPVLRTNGIANIIDLRPDGEVADQPPASAVEAVARENHMGFSYVPVSHGDIPDAAVAALDKALAGHGGPTLLYCRSGRRAVRTWSLVEASRPGGLDAAAIAAAAHAAGQPVDDLAPSIAQRVAKRGSKSE
jgi:uncharacterized protein (TIGR01244 family)